MGINPSSFTYWFVNKLLLIKKKKLDVSQTDNVPLFRADPVSPPHGGNTHNILGRDTLNTHNGNIMPQLIPGWVSGQWIKLSGKFLHEVFFYHKILSHMPCPDIFILGDNLRKKEYFSQKTLNI